MVFFTIDILCIINLDQLGVQNREYVKYCDSKWLLTLKIQNGG